MAAPQISRSLHSDSAQAIGSLYRSQLAPSESDWLAGQVAAGYPAKVVQLVVVDWKTTGDGAESLVTTSTDVAAIERQEKPTEGLFRKLASSAPSRLLALIASDELAPAQLTFAAEIAGTIPDPDVVVPVLIGLLEHASPLVREGAVLGLAHHRERALDRLRRMAGEDPSEGVRDAARDAIAPA